MLFTVAFTLNSFAPAIAFAARPPVSTVTIASTTCPNAGVRYLNGPAPRPQSHVPDGLKTMVLVQVSRSGKASGASIYKASGNIDFDRAVIDAAMKGVYAPQMQDCRPLAGRYIFEAITG